MTVRDKRPEEVARALGVSVSTIRYQAARDAFPFDRTPGGHRRYDIDEVTSVLAAQQALADQARLLSTSPEPLSDPLAWSQEYADEQLNESAALLLAATAGGERDPDPAERPLPADPFEVFAVHGAVRYPQQAHGVGAGA